MRSSRHRRATPKRRISSAWMFPSGRPFTVSSGEFSDARMDIGVVLGVVLPGFSEDSKPRASEYSGGVLVDAATRFGTGVDVGSPWRVMPRIIGEAGDGPSRRRRARFRGAAHFRKIIRARSR